MFDVFALTPAPALALTLCAALAGCGDRDLDLSENDASFTDAQARVDSGTPAPDQRLTPDALVADTMAPAPDALTGPDSGTVIPQNDYPGSGVISGEVRIDPAACPRLSCGKTPADDCRGKLYVVLSSGVHTSPVAYALVDADLSGQKPAPFRFGGLTPGKKYMIAARLFEDGVAPADRLARPGDPLRNYRNVEVPPAGYERRHDIVFTIRKGEPAVYDGTMKLTMKVTRGAKVVCTAGDPLRDCKGALEVLVMNYSQNKVEARETRTGVDFSKPGAELLITLPQTFATAGNSWPKTLFVRLYEDGQIPAKPTWDKNNLGHYESPFFVGQATCDDVQITYPAELRRGS
jgi:hypothetical protein